MPMNLLKEYNSRLELDGLDASARHRSLHGIFNRDFISSPLFFRCNLVTPTPKDGKDTMEVLFDHLTRKEENENGHREYDRDRSIRLHWVKHHILEKIPAKIDVFSVIDKTAIRTYIFDRTESYVVVLEPRKRLDIKYYYLITAYYSRGSDIFKLEKKSKRRLPIVH